MMFVMQLWTLYWKEKLPTRLCKKGHNWCILESITRCSFIQKGNLAKGKKVLQFTIVFITNGDGGKEKPVVVRKPQIF